MKNIKLIIKNFSSDYTTKVLFLFESVLFDRIELIQIVI